LWIMDRRGLSPVIAAVILVVLALIMGAMAYRYVTSFMLNQMRRAGVSIKIVYAAFVNDHTVYLYVQNTGLYSATIVDCFILDSNGSLVHEEEVSEKIEPGETHFINITLENGVFKANNLYRILVVTLTGFKAEGTYLAPRWIEN